jgi:hypothetical protein
MSRNSHQPRAHREGGAHRRGPHQPGGGEEDLPGACRRPGTLGGAAPTA